MLDGTDDFFDHGSSGSVDALLGTAAGESREQGLLTPDCFFSCAFIADVMTHRGEQRVGFVVSTTQTEEKGAKDTIRDELRYCVRHIRGSHLPKSTLDRCTERVVSTKTYLDAIVSPRKDGKFEGTWARSSAGGRTGRCTKWVVARSMICFCNCENDTKLRHQVSKGHGNVWERCRQSCRSKWQIALRANYSTLSSASTRKALHEPRFAQSVELSRASGALQRIFATCTAEADM
jgi:hypothetical protein